MRMLKMTAFLMVTLVAVVALGAVVSTSQASSSQDEGAGGSQPAPCRTDAHRAFDFWVGEWVVYDPAGNVSGHNTIELVLGGCALHESWESASGGDGHSYSFYDAASGKWHQTWIDAAGGALYLDGEWTGEVMVLGDGTNRVTWTPVPGDGVRQHWETTADGGTTWTTAFDGQYVRARQE
jgi:hypothetical protein